MGSQLTRLAIIGRYTENLSQSTCNTSTVAVSPAQQRLELGCRVRLVRCRIRIEEIQFIRIIDPLGGTQATEESRLAVVVESNRTATDVDTMHPVATNFFQRRKFSRSGFSILQTASVKNMRSVFPLGAFSLSKNSGISRMGISRSEPPPRKASNQLMSSSWFHRPGTKESIRSPVSPEYATKTHQRFCRCAIQAIAKARALPISLRSPAIEPLSSTTTMIGPCPTGSRQPYSRHQDCLSAIRRKTDISVSGSRRPTNSMGSNLAGSPS